MKLHDYRNRNDNIWLTYINLNDFNLAGIAMCKKCGWTGRILFNSISGRVSSTKCDCWCCNIKFKGEKKRIRIQMENKENAK